MDSEKFRAFVYPVDNAFLAAQRAIRAGDNSEGILQRLEEVIRLYSALLYLGGLTNEMKATIYNNRGAARYYAGVTEQRMATAKKALSNGHWFHEALGDLEEALDCDSGMKIAMVNQGAAYMATNQIFHAEEKFRTALGVNGVSVKLEVLAKKAKETIGIGICNAKDYDA